MAVEANEAARSTPHLAEAMSAVKKPKKVKKEPTAARLAYCKARTQPCCGRHGESNPLKFRELKKRPHVKQALMDMLWTPVEDVQKALCSRSCHVSLTEIENWRQHRRKPGVLEKVLEREQKRLERPQAKQRLRAEAAEVEKKERAVRQKATVQAHKKTIE